jgi:hypothetical protein
MRTAVVEVEAPVEKAIEQPGKPASKQMSE